MYTLFISANPFLGSLYLALATVLVLSIIWYIVSLIRNRNDVADIGWSTYFITIAVVTYLSHMPRLDLRLVPIVLVLIWGIRLSSHIAARHAHSGEDKRYLAWRAEWGNGVYFYVRSYLQVFLLQSVLALIIALPLIVLGTFGIAHAAWLSIGALVWIVGFALEATADKQLAAFLKNAKTPGVCNVGVWGYSRHPNYFGEAVQWWGIWVMTIGAPYFWIAILGPVVITFLLRFVSGVPLAEKSMQRLPGFAEYQKKVNIFVPGWKGR